MQILTILLALVFTLLGAPVAAQAPGMSPADPLAIARILAAKYPAQPIMSYIPALSWSGSLRLSALTGEPRWREKALKDMQPFISGQTPAMAEPYRLTSLAGALAFFDAAALGQSADAGALAQKVATFITDTPPGTYRFATHWTDDMFMVGSVLSRPGNDAWASRLSTMLTTYANQLQRPDGLFNHATDGPHAWGRGNGFALLGVTEALTRLPDRGWNAVAARVMADGTVRDVCSGHGTDEGLLPEPAGRERRRRSRRRHGAAGGDRDRDPPPRPIGPSRHSCSSRAGRRVLRPA